MPIDSPLVERARELSRVAHARQVRKSGGVPYFVHLDSVVTTLVEHGYEDDTTLSAAYLHDLLEDQPAHAARFRAEMPPDVIETVEALTEVKEEGGKPLDKRARFARYVEGLSGGGAAARRAIPISCADKIDNARSLLQAERARDSLLLRLKTRPGEHATQLATLRAVYDGAVAPALLSSFDAAAAELEATIDAWLPGRAVQLAATAHLGQYDRGGHPYIGHPLRLWMRAQGRDDKIVAVLHDVIEDTPWTLDELKREGFSERVLRALSCLTKEDGESYDAFIERIAADRMATRVKLLDLEDNSDVTRLPEVTERDRERLEKYQRAMARLRLEQRKRSLYVVLDSQSRDLVRGMAVHPEVRGEHVTLAHRVVPESFSTDWVPGGATPGQALSLRAVGHARDQRVQALLVELAGSTRRPQDGGLLHVTVSRAAGARSRDSNALLSQGPGQPVDLNLRGTVAWVDD